MPSLARSVRALISTSPFLTQSSESAYRLAQLALRPRKISGYFSSTDRVRLMIGAGPSRKDGWLSTDLLPSRRDVVLLDASEPFPFDDGAIDLIHSEHMIEHVDFPIGAGMLAECYRVLAPGGRIRLATPDAERVLALADPDPELAEMLRQSNLRRGVSETDASEPLFAVNRLFSAYGHRFLYSEELLQTAMERAGFRDVERFDVGQSNELDFVDAEQHGNQIDAEWNRYQTMVLEAVKPATARS